MEMIDEQGNLLGVVNVIDALAVLLVISTVVAGIAVVEPFEETREVTRYVTIEIDRQPTYVSSLISEGDVMGPTVRGHNLTITDVYVGPAGNGSTTTVIRAEVEGRVSENDEPIEFSDTVIRAGNSIEIQTIDYQLTGTIISVDSENHDLRTTETTVKLRTTVDDTIAQLIERGQRHGIAGHSTATIESVATFPTENNGKRLVLLEVSLQTLRTSGEIQYGGRRLEIGTTIPFKTDSYSLSGTVVEQGQRTGNVETRSITAVVKLENLEPEQVEVLEVGSAEQSRGDTYARVVDKRVEPAVVILTSEDGNIYEREHPRNKDVFLTVELTARRAQGDVLFHGKRLEYGTEIVLEFDRIAVRGNVTEIVDDQGGDDGS